MKEKAKCMTCNGIGYIDERPDGEPVLIRHGCGHQTWQTRCPTCRGERYMKAEKLEPVTTHPTSTIPVISSFRGEYEFLSNFYLVPIPFEGITYPSVENAYQAAKTHPHNRRIFVKATAAEAKKMGQQVTLPPNWERMRLYVMKTLISIKFPPGGELARKLLATHPAGLIEGNTWGDVFWGVCNGTGENMLGKILMLRRFVFYRREEDIRLMKEFREFHGIPEDLFKF